MAPFVPRQRKRRVLDRQRAQKRQNQLAKDAVDENEGDSNALEILPVEEEARMVKKRELAEAIKSEQPGMSGKKRKRLDKYIDKKLRKEETAALLHQLEERKVDTALLKSSRDLGVTRLPKREVLGRALEETRRGINVEENESILFEQNHGPSEDDGVSEDGGEKVEEGQQGARVSAAPVVGSGLKRPLEIGEDGRPIFTKRKRRKVEDWKPEPFAAETDGLDTEDEDTHKDQGSSWSGFSDTEVKDSESSSEPSDEDSDSEMDEDEESEGSFSSSDENGDGEIDDLKARSSAFKAWATGQINEAVGFVPTAAPSVEYTLGQEGRNESDIQYTPKPLDIEPLPPELAVKINAPERKAHGIIVNRPEDIQTKRMDLPILADEQRIMEAVHNNPTVVICGETGSGKTTQVPQFLYEAGYGAKDGPSPGMIGITQPRRVAAVSMAARVAHELGGEHASKVSHQVRFDSSVSKDTAVKFMTDGILLREISKDFALQRYSAIVVDEAHERSSNTDILLGLLSRIVDLREEMTKDDRRVKPLKLVIMSATLRVQDFLDNQMLFKGSTPPLVQVEGRQYPVTMHFSRRTQSDYVEQIFQKVCRGHKLLPPGGILVFMTAQDEISALISKLHAALGTENVDKVIINGDSDDSASEDDPDEFDVEDEDDRHLTPKVHILPLYSQLPTQDQLRVFEPQPEGSRLIVVATNVAETSLTIPGIRYVFDCGRSKEKRFDDVSGVQSFEIGWISKANASQRAGRAGRTGPGHCYRMYSSAVYERDFEEYPTPEILRMPVEGVVLQLKSMELHNVVNFPFPSPPERQGLAKAEKLLKNLGALTMDGKITNVGRGLTVYPISPRFAKMLAVGHQYKCMEFTILLVSVLATPNLFLLHHQLGLTRNEEPDTPNPDEAKQKRASDYNHAHYVNSGLSRTSDALKAMNALQGYFKASDKEQYCREMFLSAKQAQEASNLSDQLTSIIRNINPLHFSDSTPSRATPSKDQVAALQQFIAAGFLDQIAILASDVPSPPYLGRTPKRPIDVPYLPLFPISQARSTTDTDIRDIAVYIHPSSVLAHLSIGSLPKYVIYSHLQRAQPSTIEGAKKPRTRMHPLTTVTDRTISALAKGTPLLEYGKPLSIVEEKVGAKGKQRTCIVQPSLVGEKGTLGWPLPAQKVVQTRDAKGVWVVE